MATGIQVVSTSGSGIALTNSVRTRYINDYLEGAMGIRLYDQLAEPVGMDMSRLKAGSSVTIPVLSEMSPGVTAISEVTDITPQILRDSTLTLTPTSRGEALKASELLLIQNYTNYGAAMFRRVGQSLMESVDILARQASVAGDINLQTVARASLNAGSTGHRASETLFSNAMATLQSLKAPNFVTDNGVQTWAAIMHPHVFHDIREEASSSVLFVGQYQRAGIALNFELAQLGPFRFLVSPWAKVFGGAGADNASDADTTLSSAQNALQTTIAVASTSNIKVGKYITLGTEETGSTYQPTNERVLVNAVQADGTVDIIGEGPNAGLRFDHASGDGVRNADSAYTIVFGGPNSLQKIFATEIGEFGQIVGPSRDGILDQWVNVGYKWYGTYGRVRENTIARAEVSVSAENV